MNFFKTDKQTLDDLNILGKPGAPSVYNFYNKTRTKGGSDLLEEMFLYPLADPEVIRNRCQTIRYFTHIHIDFPFETQHIDSAETYLAMTDERTRLKHQDKNITQKITQLISVDNDYKLISTGIMSVVALFQDLQLFLKKIDEANFNSDDNTARNNISALLKTPEISLLLNEQSGARLSHTKMVEYDSLLRFRYKKEVKQLLAHIYRLDVYISVAQVAMENQFAFPKILSSNDKAIRLTNVFHLLVKNAIANTVTVSSERNIIFLTGANMAGKSTLMKSIGIAVYLAHMGFPVAAEAMELGLCDGIFTTINLPDDLGAGNSHFYAEAMRIKMIAKEMGNHKRLLIMFDELFRGTNVKDAYEGTVAISEAFAAKKNCFFIVSTHIMEAGTSLKNRYTDMQFVYLPTHMNGNTPAYTYQLRQGITDDRQGMTIINNEGIIDIIKTRKTKAKAV